MGEPAGILCYMTLDGGKPKDLTEDQRSKLPLIERLHGYLQWFSFAQIAIVADIEIEDVERMVLADTSEFEYHRVFSRLDKVQNTANILPSLSDVDMYLSLPGQIAPDLKRLAEHAHRLVDAMVKKGISEDLLAKQVGMSRLTVMKLTRAHISISHKDYKSLFEILDKDK